MGKGALSILAKYFIEVFGKISKRSLSPQKIVAMLTEMFETGYYFYGERGL